jgi:hypothetical protein
VLLTTAKLSPSLVFVNRPERCCWTCEKAAVMAGSCRMAGLDKKLLCTSGTQAETTRLGNMHVARAAVDATETRLEACVQGREHRIVPCDCYPIRSRRN